jgi:hypothetical protein
MKQAHGNWVVAFMNGLGDGTKPRPLTHSGIESDSACLKKTIPYKKHSRMV